MLDGEFAIHNVRLLSGESGLFTAMPDYEDRFGNWRDHCFPCTPECAAAIDAAVIAAYREACGSLL